MTRRRKLLKFCEYYWSGNYYFRTNSARVVLSGPHFLGPLVKGRGNPVISNLGANRPVVTIVTEKVEVCPRNTSNYNAHFRPIKGHPFLIRLKSHLIERMPWSFLRISPCNLCVLGVSVVCVFTS
jgi:hypothetical protein